MVVLQVLQGNGVQQTGDAAARPAAATEVGAGQRQGPLDSSPHDDDAGEAMTQQMLNQVVGPSVSLMSRLPLRSC